MILQTIAILIFNDDDTVTFTILTPFVGAMPAILSKTHDNNKTTWNRIASTINKTNTRILFTPHHDKATEYLSQQHIQQSLTVFHVQADTTTEIINALLPTTNTITIDVDPLSIT
ncbi:MAG: hypothetical protein D6790_14985 [Caldilineae bacterium]|nr:MAG: hypothetical protein D6790_14985 [Caldilineae bacterium]